MAKRDHMSFELSQDWVDRMASMERDACMDIGAGMHQFIRIVEGSNVASPAEPLGQTNVVFGRFVHLMRRQRGLTVEGLANSTGIEIEELLEIEDDVHHRPEPRCVYLLADYFQLPAQNLYTIAGLAQSGGSRLFEEGVRFAARSNTTSDLSSEERLALEAFVLALSEQK